MADAVLRHYEGVSAAQAPAVCHCNFSLRGTESDADEAFVREWCASRGVECIVKRFDTELFAKEAGLSVEMAARELRYRLFDELCSERGFSCVMVAHNANDNAETMLLNLLRGTGIDGVCGMREVSENPFGICRVVRPLLRYSRTEIEEYALSRGLKWRTDSTNASSLYKRNLIRNEVFPLFEKINPSFIETFGRDAANFSQAAAIARDYAAKELETLVKPSAEGSAVEIAALMSRPHWEYLLYQWLAPFGFNQDAVAALARTLTDAASGECVSPVSGKQFLPAEGTFRLVTTSAHLILAEEKEQAQDVVVELLEWPSSGISVKTPRGVILLDADKLPSDAPVIRPWKDGDYLCPIGLKGRKKVSDLMTDLHYNALQKEKALVVEGLSGSHVAALVGERIDERYRITALSRRVYRISIK